MPLDSTARRTSQKQEGLGRGLRATADFFLKRDHHGVRFLLFITSRYESQISKNSEAWRETISVPIL
jgi:hypothetical protein